jgi:hypothetical protein
MASKRRVPPIVWTILCILVFALGATSYSKTADILVIVVRMSVVLVLSGLGLREWWKYHHRSGWSNSRKDAASTLLRRWRRWFTDDQSQPRSG